MMKPPSLPLDFNVQHHQHQASSNKHQSSQLSMEDWIDDLNDQVSDAFASVNRWLPLVEYS
jgi:hypothetical protein